MSGKHDAATHIAPVRIFSSRRLRTLQQPLQVELDGVLVEGRLTFVERAPDIARLGGEPAAYLDEGKSGARGRWAMAQPMFPSPMMPIVVPASPTG